MISSPAPGTFVHLGHVGFNYKGEIATSDGMDPGWTTMLEELQGYSVSNPLTDGDRESAQRSLAGEKTAPVTAASALQTVDQLPGK